MSGTEFNIFGEGKSPTSSSKGEEIRNQYASVIYSLKHYDDSKKMTILIPYLLNEEKAYVWKPMNVIRLMRIER